MLHTKVINGLHDMGNLVFPPPRALLEILEDIEHRGEKWWAIMAYEGYGGDARWVLGLRASGKSHFFAEGSQVSGQWDRGHEIFIPNDGPAFDLRGKAVSLSSLIEQEEEESAEEEEKAWEFNRQQARESGAISWGVGEF